ncbi:MAG: Rne/Rng family ribonuclease [Limnochordales bacterium]|nr:Rne/Rng family ribonuclease [Limnochordales bacterium]
MSKEILINVNRMETRAAVLEDGRLVELHVERESNQRVAGNIYKGRVVNVLPGMQAAFVDIGLEKNAFLYVADLGGYLHQAEEENEAVVPFRPQAINEILKEGQEIVVQVTKDPIGTKGARVVTHLSIPGRYLVLMPTVEYVGISRRIDDPEERERLKGLARKIRPRNAGLIVRTAAEGEDEEELKRDLRFLLRTWEKIKSRARKLPAPALLYKDYDLVYRVVRDIFTDEVDRLVIDSRAEYQKTLQLLKGISPELRERVELYDGEVPLFEARGLENEIERALKRKVWLPSGGYLVIDETEALTSIDVNTGKFIGSTNLADTVLKTNLEATAEIARQLRLRNLGGIIVVDFIDMDSEEDKKKVLAQLIEEIGKDKTKTHVLGFTHLGLVEITRKKTRQSLTSFLERSCPYCDGTGRVLSEETVGAKAEREIRKLARMADVEAILVALHPSVAAMVIGTGGSNLKRLEEETHKTIYIKGNDRLHMEEIRVVAAGSKAEVEAKAMPVREGQVVDVEVEEPHITNPQDGIARLEGYVLNIEGGGRHVGERLKVEITKVFRTYARGRMVTDSAATPAGAGGV